MSSSPNSDTKRYTQSSGSRNPFTELESTSRHICNSLLFTISDTSITSLADSLQACKLHLCAKTVERSTKAKGARQSANQTKREQMWLFVVSYYFSFQVVLFRNDGSLHVHDEHLTHTKEKTRDVPIPVVADWTCFSQLACGVWCDDIWLSRNKENWSAKYFWEKNE